MLGAPLKIRLGDDGWQVASPHFTREEAELPTKRSSRGVLGAALGLVAAAGAAYATRVIVGHARSLVTPPPGAPTPPLERGWAFAGPKDLGIPFREVAIPTVYGPAPAWHFTPAPSTDWAIHVHGRTATRGETLRGVQVVSRLGWQSLSISLRNDSEGPASPSGKYELGLGEAEDVAAAVDWAKRHGAKRIVLFGWSMGGAAVVNTQRVVDGLILESPALSWRSILDNHADSIGAPRWLNNLVRGVLATKIGARAAGASQPINWSAAESVPTLLGRTEPALLLVSLEDETVPADPAIQAGTIDTRRLTVEVFESAAHCQLWNAESARWEAAIEHAMTSWFPSKPA